MTFLSLMLRLVAAHVLMDFIFQSSKMVKAKTSGTTSQQLAYNLGHSLLHAMATYLIVGQCELWYIPVIIFVSHFGIDFFYKRNKDGIVSFIIDQILHLLIIIGICIFVAGKTIDIDQISDIFNSDKFWIICIAYLLITKPTSVFIGKFISRWKPQINKQSNTQLTSDEEKGLDRAGEWIGYIERLLILSFIMINQWSAIGFLLAAKSIFRYGNLKENTDIRMTEYVLIGTLCSFAIAIIIGMAVKFMI